MNAISILLGVFFVIALIGFGRYFDFYNRVVDELDALVEEHNEAVDQIENVRDHIEALIDDDHYMTIADLEELRDMLLL